MAKKTIEEKDDEIVFEIENYDKNTGLEKGQLYQGKNGKLYRLVDGPFYKAVVNVPDIREVAADELEESVLEINIPKIPYDLFRQIHSFFKDVYNTHKSEVAILLWYNFEFDKWYVEVPEQTVSGASVNYKSNEEELSTLQKSGYVRIGSIHSHCEMGAFHSGTDDGDEYGFDGVHITIGKVISGPEYAQRYMVKKIAKKIETIQEVVEMPLTTPITFPEAWKARVTTRPTTYYNTKDWLYGKFSKTKETKLTGYVTSDLETSMTPQEKDKRITRLPKEGGSFICPHCANLTRIGKNRTCNACAEYLWMTPEELVSATNNTSEEETLEDYYYDVSDRGAGYRKKGWRDFYGYGY